MEANYTQGRPKAFRDPISRGEMLTVGAALLGIGSLALYRPGQLPEDIKSPTLSPRDFREQAWVTYQAANREFYQPNLRFYTDGGVGQGSRPYADLWPFAVFLSATLTLNRLRQNDKSLQLATKAAFDDGLSHYLDRRPGASTGYFSEAGTWSGVFSKKYIDDSAWIGQLLLRYHEQFDKPWARERAGKLWEFVTSENNVSSSDTAAPGGLYWVEQTGGETNKTLGAVENLGVALLGLKLSALENDPLEAEKYLHTSLKLYEWVNEYLKDPLDGLIMDHIPQGIKDFDHWADFKFTYNQGLALSCATKLYLFTGDKKYITRATKLAGSSLQAFTEGKLHREPEFDVVYYKALLELSAVLKGNGLNKQAETLKDAAMNEVENHSESVLKSASIHMPNGLILYQRTGRNFLQYKATLKHQSAFSEIIALAALPEDQWGYLI